jgi:glucose/arabinose dehydrogenase
MRIPHVSIAALAAVLGACSSGEPQLAQQDTSDARASQETVGPSPAPAGDPVDMGPPNKKDAQPAFAGQTRAPAVSSGVKLKVERVADGIDEPWGVALLPEGDLLVTARTGKLWRVSPTGQKSEVAGPPEVDNRGQGGLLDISLAPDFATSRGVYICFAEPRGSNTNGTSLARGTLSADGSRLEGVSVIFRQTPAWASTNHYGCNIEWPGDGNLFLVMGERSSPEPRKLSQDLGAHLGKVVRLTPDGKAAPGNPFIGRAGALPEIWSYGHRNMQGAAIDPQTGKLWTIEHGPRGGDELNAPEAGKNYGWPVISYGIEYVGGPIGEGVTARDGMEQPVYYWDPVIAPGDMTFYTGDLFPWKGDLLIAGLRGMLVRLEIENGRVTGEEHLLNTEGRLRDVTQAADGSLWVVTDEPNGKVLKVTPAD